MSSNKHLDVVQIFLGACEMEGDALESYLDLKCGDNLELRAEVEELLSHDRTHGIIDKPVAQIEIGAVVDDTGSVPSQIGQYEILDVLGEGGMGTVYRARQSQPNREVALKVIRAGLSSRALIRRFEQEAQLLGLLQDPGIAQIYEAGTANAGHGPQPFFAMELVQGDSLTDHAGRLSLDIPARLKLLADVCGAVHHAHQKGIIHRDLKPGNVLVTQAGQPKILDFGVARATDADIKTTTLQTDVGQLIGTVPYMSPEQVSGDPNAVDIRSDVYALGVIGYELLTGQLPHDLTNKALPDAVRVIRDEDPDRLSSMNRFFRGDIETIFAKALEKDKTRRYQSAAELAADIQRYLDDEPISARPPSAVYQFRKFARRNRAVVWSGTTVVFTLVVALIVTIAYAVKAADAEERAVDERDLKASALTRALTAEGIADDKRKAAEEALERAVEAEELADRKREDAENALAESMAVTGFLVQMLRTANPDIEKKDVTVREVLDKSKVRVAETFADKPVVEARLQTVIGQTYSELGLPQDAEPHLLRAMELWEEVEGAQYIERLAALKHLAMNHQFLGRNEKAAEAWKEAYEGLSAQLPETHEQVLHAMVGLSVSLRSLGRLAEAEEMLRKTYEVRKVTLGEEDPITVNNAYELGVIYSELGRQEEAEEWLNLAIEGETRNRGEDHPRVLVARYSLSLVRSSQRRYEESSAIQEDVLEKAKRVLGEEHGFPMAVAGSLASYYAKSGRDEEAEALLKNALAIELRVYGEEHHATQRRQMQLARIYSQRGEFERAETMLLNTLKIRRRTQGDDHPHTFRTLDNLGDLYRDWGKYEEAIPMYKECLEGREKILGPMHPRTIGCYYELGIVYFYLERYDEAVETDRIAVERAREVLPPDHDDFGLFLRGLALALHGAGKTEESMPYLTEAYQVWEKTRGADHPTTIEIAQDAVTAYKQLEQPEKAAEWQAKIPASEDPPAEEATSEDSTSEDPATPDDSPE